MKVVTCAKWEKINKNTWRIATNGARQWSVKYRVYANELSVRTSELNSSHGFWNNANLLMYLDGFLKSPSTVRVIAPDVWKVATGLPPVPGERNTFRAENFDVLYDSPFEASNFKTIVFNVKGIPHRIVIDGEGNYDPERMRRDVQQLVETQIELMGGDIPYRDYRCRSVPFENWPPAETTARSKATPPAKEFLPVPASASLALLLPVA